MASAQRKLSVPEKLDLWRLWRAGRPLIQIAKALEISVPGVAKNIHRTGGVAPRHSVRSKVVLGDDEREAISRGLAKHWSIRRIAVELGRAPSTIAREVSRNGGRSAYRAVKADRRAWKCARRPKRCKLAINTRLRKCVAAKLEQKWSPEQIAGWLRRNFADDPSMQVSHETIYRTLFVQTRNALRKELVKHLRTQRDYRKPKKSRKGKTAAIVDGVSIRERPAEADDRAVPGHWEGDLLFGTAYDYIATLVERHSRFTMLAKITSKDSETVTTAIRKLITKLPDALQRSLTWDCGSEMSGHKKFVVETGLPVYFCDPHSPWQRGSNENTNGLLRQYFPRGQSVAHITQAELNKVARELNGRPRETLDFRTPAEALNEVLR
jgi:IS30 family transposase